LPLNDFDEILWTEREYWFSHSKEKFSDNGTDYQIIEWIPSTQDQIQSAKPTPAGQRKAATAKEVFAKMSPIEWYTKTTFVEWASVEFHIGIRKTENILKLFEENELVEVSEEKRSGTNSLKRYRKLNKTYA
jgi:hypothetical protein